MKLAIIDLETTGLNPVMHETWELALIACDGAQVTSEWVWQFAVDLRTADPDALTIGRFWARFDMNKTQHDPTEASELLADRVLVTSNPAFDADFLARLLRSHGSEPSWHYRPVNVQDLAVGWLHARGETVDWPWSSSELSRRCGVEPPGEDERHTALGDARWVHRWLTAMGWIGGP